MKNRRYTLVVDKDFQYNQISKAILTMIILGNTALVILLLLLKSEAVQLLDITAATILAISELLMVAGIFYLGLKATHRIAGPALAVKNALEQLGNGDLTARVTLRETDYLQDIGDSFNANAERLDSKIKTIQALARSLNASLDGNDGGVQMARDLERALAAFNTRNDSMRDSV
ncbi:MAG: methyl-accepting chemotaxis protein [Pseudomonadota bacterium]